jgi:hypothetical protein
MEIETNEDGGQSTSMSWQLVFCEYDNNKELKAGQLFSVVTIAHW